MSALLNASGAIIDTDVNINDRFEFKIQTPADNSTFILGIQINNAVTIYWGDGTVEENISADYPSHTYSTAGIYSISVQRYGQGSHCITSLRFFHDAPSAQMVFSVDNLGTIWRDPTFSTYQLCRDCSNMISFSSGNTNAGLYGYEAFWGCSSCTYFDISTMRGGTAQYGRTFLGCSSAEFVNVGGLHGQTASPSRFLQNNLPAECEVIGVENFGPPTSNSGYQDFIKTQEQYEKLLLNWGARSLTASGISVNFGSVNYAANGSAAEARQSIIDTYGWVITDGGEVDAPFQFTIETTTTNESFTIPCQNIGTFDATIDWGDGSATQTITSYNDANLTHTFATAGTYQIEISGKFPNVYFYGDATSRLKILSVDNLGTMGWQGFENAFRNCSNMTSFTPGTTSTSDVTNMRAMFNSCSSLTSLDLTSFDTSNVTNISSMFGGCSLLTTVDLSSFDTSNVTNMGGMFYFCSSLTSLDVTNFNTEKVTTMSGMFGLCESLTTLDISHFRTPALTGGLNEMFRRSPIAEVDIRGFDTSNVTSLYFVFERFQYPTRVAKGLETLDVSNMTNLRFAFLYAGPGTEQYDKMLINYSRQNLQSNVELYVHQAKYTPGGEAEAARQFIVDNYGWVITDGGPVV